MVQQQELSRRLTLRESNGPAPCRPSGSAEGHHATRTSLNLNFRRAAKNTKYCVAFLLSYVVPG